ncbi:DUF1697 domain-containing protein [Mangrovicoccus sp. HB161399]|uniref:DUF1697 domain-containing protein n=1 Tax=Mangrovicoccus sp. HB161399 TaxID=2720392 RepID=UPI001556CABF|nr:DUF1697 domain-containing protein [Mangrovicoccus sp. HB161399]
MRTLVALLRAVNVGGTGKLPMAELRALCTAAGFAGARTHIQSGNLLFETGRPAAEAKAELEARLSARMGKPATVLLREAAEMQQILAANPFPRANPAKVAVLFLDGPAPADPAASATGRAGEDIAAGTREIYIFYSGGMGRSRLKLPEMAEGTARNLRTVARLAAMADGGA